MVVVVGLAAGMLALVTLLGRVHCFAQYQDGYARCQEFRDGYVCTVCKVIESWGH